MTNTRKNFLKLIFTLFFVLCPLFICFSQTANQIETLLQTPSATYTQAAWLVLESANTSGFDRSAPDSAFNYAVGKKWLPANVKAADRIKLQEASLLIMQAFNIKGGFWYNTFKNPHYAYREMVYQGLIYGRTEPGMAVPGEQLLYLVNRVVYLMDDNPWTMPKRSEPAAVIVHDEAVVEEELTLVEEINAQLESLEVTDVSARLTDEGVTISLSNIRFLADSSVLPESEKQVIREIAGILKSISARKILISGHTADTGTGVGLQTSLERAQAVADYLVELGVRNSDELVVQGFGSERPVADNSTPEGMALNRRVEITILEDQQ